MPIIGGMVRQAIILRVGEVIHVAIIKEPRGMMQDVVYEEAFPLDKIDEAFNSVYQQMLEQEHKA